MSATGVVVENNRLKLSLTASPFTPIIGQNQKLAEVAGVDGKAVAVTNIWTATDAADIQFVKVIPTTIDALTAGPTAGVGIAAGESDISPARKLNGLALNKPYVFAPAGLVRRVASGEVVKLGIDIGATATTLTLAIELWGAVLP